MQLDEWYLSFSRRFRAFVEANGGFPALADRTGYTEKYLRWVAGVTGQMPWPGTYRFVRRMRDEVGMDTPLPPRPQAVYPCPCGEVHTRLCQFGRSKDPAFLRAIKTVAVPFLDGRQNGRSP